MAASSGRGASAGKIRETPSSPAGSPGRPILSPPSPLPLIVLLTVGHVSFGGARLAISLQALQLQASPITVGLLMGLLMLIPTFVSVAVGRWVDRVGYRRPTAWGLLAMLVGELAAAVFASVPTLVATALLTGTGFMLAHVAINNAIGQVAGPASRARAFGIMAFGFSVSAFIGPMAAGLAIDHLGFRTAFALLALATLGAAWLLRQGPLVPGQRADERRAPARVTELLQEPALRAVLVVSGLLAAGWDLFTFLVPLYGARIGLSASAIGLVAGGFGVGSAIVRLALPWLLRRVNEWKLIAAALGLSAIGYFVMPFCTGVSSMLPLAAALGMVLGCGQPIVMSLLHVTAPAGRSGEAVGLRTAIVSLGQTVLPLVFGAFGSATGMLPLFWALAAMLGGGSGYALRRRPARA